MPQKVPPELKKITPYVRRAEELDADSSPQSRVVAYYCRQYAVQVGIPLIGNSTAGKECLGGLLSELEKEKTAMSVFNRQESQQICRAFADKVLERANGPDRAGMADKNTARTFYAAASFYEILLQFYPKTENEDDKAESQIEEDEKRVYCKWKATEILKAIREGRKPTPGGYLDPVAGSEPEPEPEVQTTVEEQTIEVEKEVEQVIPSAPNLSMARSEDSEEEIAAEVGTEVPLHSYTQKTDLPPPYPVQVEDVGSSSSDEEVYMPPPPKPTIPQPKKVAFTPPPSMPPQKPSKSRFGFGKKSKSKVSKETLADATELTTFALKALKDKDAELAAERLSQALEILNQQ